MPPDIFSKTIETYTRQITAELLETKLTVANENAVLCPKCKTANLRFYPKVVKCADGQCGLVIFRNVCEKQLSEKQIADLLSKGKTGIIKGFKTKMGKTFDAVLMFDENFKVAVSLIKKN